MSEERLATKVNGDARVTGGLTSAREANWRGVEYPPFRVTTVSHHPSIPDIPIQPTSNRTLTNSSLQ